ncbi:oligosaccharide flippase family protein [Roseobacter sp. GAI101]|uniref:oligosaccharide flippase family protein n=1 Tax=Roseobacter sp. (strain GAI101) TaxID=391589 RepID=UPI00018720FD|nr:oligosaccharide flippase family protein [Roseobacter sp. GAI101]EEB83876.1 putative flippase [Roseobacter sp. GAI101]
MPTPKHRTAALSDRGNQAGAVPVTAVPDEEASRQKLRLGTVQIGFVSMLNVAAAFVRYKFVTVILGTAGLGIYGILQNVTGMVAALATMGLAFSLTGAVAKAAGDAPRQAMIVSHTLLVLAATAVTAALVSIAFGMTVLPALIPFGDGPLLIWWLLPCLPIMVWCNALGAGLMGHEETRKFARATLVANIIAIPVGIWLIWVYGTGGLFPLILVYHLVRMMVLAQAYGRDRLVEMRKHLRIRAAWRTVRPMMLTGLHFMSGGALGVGSVLVVQHLILTTYGLPAVGGFQGVYAIAFQISAFLLLSFQANLYPQLSRAGSDHARARKISNDQARLLLIVVGGVLLGVNGFSTAVFSVLFSSELTGLVTFAAIWFVGEVVKSLAWIPIFNLLARDRNGAYLVTQVVAAVVYVATVGLVVLLDQPFDYVAFANVTGPIAMLVTGLLLQKEGILSYWQRDVKLIAAQLILGLGVVAALRLIDSPAAFPVGVGAMAAFSILHLLEIRALFWQRVGPKP